MMDPFAQDAMMDMIQRGMDEDREAAAERERALREEIDALKRELAAQSGISDVASDERDRAWRAEIERLRESRDRIARIYILVSNWRNEMAEELQWLYGLVDEYDIPLPDEGEDGRPVARMDFRRIMEAKTAERPEDIPDALRDEVWATMYMGTPEPHDAASETEAEP